MEGVSVSGTRGAPPYTTPYTRYPYQDSYNCWSFRSIPTGGATLLPTVPIREYRLR
mgnify:CR=1 FL=1